MTAIAVLGAGVVGRTLAARWARAGHDVILGSRDPGADRVAAAVAETGAARAATHADAARGAELTVVTVPGEQVEDLVAALGPSVAERVVVDATNVLAPDAAVLHHVDTFTKAGAVVYRAFNSTGWEQMARPVFGAQRSDMPYAGPDGPYRALVETAVADIGFRPVWIGRGPGHHRRPGSPVVPARLRPRLGPQARAAAAHRRRRHRQRPRGAVNTPLESEEIP
jgi:8-hydroxy-5-deazaflavin:NADPH oxidoreductase